MPDVDTNPVVVQHEPEDVAVEQQEPAVEVNLTPKEPEVKETKPGLDEVQIRALENKVAAARRITEERDRLRRELEHVKQQLATQVPKPAPAPQPQLDELDQLVEQGRWKEAVKQLSAQQVQEMLRQQDAINQQQQELNLRTSTLEQSKKNVLGKYPELSDNGDPESPISKAYIQVLNEDPKLLADPYGPEVAMARMERKLAETNPEASREVVRRSRAGQTALPPSRPNVRTNTVTLTKEQKDFCDQNSVSYEQYARTLRTMEQTGEVS